VQYYCQPVAPRIRQSRFQDTEPTGQVQWQQLPARVQVQVRCDVPQPIHIRFDDNDRRGLDFSFGEEGRATVMFSEAFVDNKSSQFVVHHEFNKSSESQSQTPIAVLNGDTVELQQHHQPVNGMSATFLLTVIPVQARSFQVSDQQASTLSLRMTVPERDNSMISFGSRKFFSVLYTTSQVLQERCA
jgi:hypothetical protein